MTVNNDNIKANASAVFGLLRTVSNGVYPSVLTKLREAVANSQDSNATQFHIHVSEVNKSISLFDNGDGFAESKLISAIENIGVGLNKHLKDKNSFFGLGFFSVLNLGIQVDIYTCSKEGKHHFIVESNSIFAEENENNPITSLTEHIRSVEYRLDDHKKTISYGFHSELIESGNTFTDISIKCLDKKMIREITTNDFIIQLRKYLPLKPIENESFFKKIYNDEQRKEIIDLHSSDYVKNIDCFLCNYDQSNMNSIQLFKYFPYIKSNINFLKENVHIIKSDSYAMYYCYDFEEIEARSSDSSSSTGLWVRNKNYLVQPSSNLQKPGTRKKLFDEPIKKWVYGEIFHFDMHRMLNVNRDGFNWEDKDFLDFFDEVKEQLGNINQYIRYVYNLRSSTYKSCVEPFQYIADPKKSPLQHLAKRLDNLADKDAEFKPSDFFNRLAETFDSSYDYDSERIDIKFKDIDEDELIYTDDEKSLYVSPDKSDYVDEWRKDEKHLNAYIPISTYNSKTIEILRNKVTLAFIASNEINNPISYDKTNSVLYINVADKTLHHNVISMLDLVIAVEVARSISNDKHDMRDNIFKILKKEDLIEDVSYATRAASIFED